MPHGIPSPFLTPTPDEQGKMIEHLLSITMAILYHLKVDPEVVLNHLVSKELQEYMIHFQKVTVNKTKDLGKTIDFLKKEKKRLEDELGKGL